MWTHVERVSPIPAIAVNCESPSESGEHLAGDRDSEAEACESHEDVRVSDVGHVGQDVGKSDDELSEIDEEISEADMMSDESHETVEWWWVMNDDDLDEISDLWGWRRRVSKNDTYNFFPL